MRDTLRGAPRRAQRTTQADAQSLAVHWRDDIFERPTLTSVGPDGKVVRRTILMESEVPQTEEEVPDDVEPVVLAASISSSTLRDLAGLALSLGLLVGCSPASNPNVLFIVVDTLRADHLGCYGHARPTSPAIDGLAAEGVRFERAYATAPWTKPSIASMITGRYPASLGINQLFSRLPQPVDTLAEILRRHGYRTAASVSHVMLSDKDDMGFGQGYETYLESEARGYAYVTTDGVTQQALELLDTLSQGDRPFLLFVHYFDPHFDYLDHEGIDFAAPRGERLDGHERMSQLREIIGELSDTDLAFLRDRYDEEIRATDAGIGRLLAGLRARGLERETLVVFTSDHGEEFGEKGWLGHIRTLYDFVVHVPLIIRAPDPDRRAGLVQQTVSLVSLTPTILELLGIESADDQFQGRSFADLVREQSGRESGLAFTEVDFPVQDPRISSVALRKRALVGERFKLIANDEDGTVQLYDLIADPREENDLSAQRPELRDRLLGELRERTRQARLDPLPNVPRTFTEAEIEALRALGYVQERKHR